MIIDRAVIGRMKEMAKNWEQFDDKRAIFLSCYSMMTDNMLSALEENRFQDNEWVHKLLHRFSEYYFDALACYDCGENVPLVWQKVHQVANTKSLHVVQHLLLGVNAHINYDLVLTLHEMLSPEWKELNEAKKRERYQDHCMVNTIISETIDKVQDEVIEVHDPFMDFVDKLFGRMDEFLLSRLISSWREDVWEFAVKMLECQDQERQNSMKASLEKKVLKIGRRLEFSL